MSERHPLDEAIALEPAAGSPDLFHGRTHEDYANMVGPFGGLTAAVQLSAVLRHPALLGEPLAVTVNFAGPVTDGDYTIRAVPVRTNRSSQHWIVEQRQGDALVTSATVVTAVRRASFDSTETLPPQAVPPEDLARRDGPVPLPWLSRYDLRFVSGGLAPSGDPAGESATVLWARDDPPRPLDPCSLLALSDAFFPRVFLRTGALAPAGTVSVTTYLHGGEEERARVGDDFVLGRAVGQRFAGGYFDQAAQLWSRTGALLATSHQIVYFKA